MRLIKQLLKKHLIQVLYVPTLEIFDYWDALTNIIWYSGFTVAYFKLFMCQVYFFLKIIIKIKFKRVKKKKKKEG